VNIKILDKNKNLKQKKVPSHNTPNNTLVGACSGKKN
jgi:hypothetical protein